VSAGTSPPPPLTVGESLRLGAAYLAERGITSARLEADLILAHVLGLTRLQLYLAFERPLTGDERARARALMARRAKREPLAYLTGERECFSLALEITPDVFIPCAETELLIETVIDLDRKGEIPGGEILDIGTGSGCIAVALAKWLPGRRFVATDVSAKAIEVAKRNASRHGISERVTFLEGDLNAGRTGPFAAVVSNPPYVADSDRSSLAPEVLAEPPEALFAGPDGLEVIRRIIAAAPEILTPGGRLLLEVGLGQADAVGSLMNAAGLVEIQRLRDLAGVERAVIGKRC
jgi:release factor glutamine methyltransferase